MIEDESAQCPDDLYYSLPSALAVSPGQLVLLSTPYGRRGHFHHEWTEDGDGCHRASVTTEQCPRIIPVWLAEERARISDCWFRHEFCCEFVETVEQVFGYDLVMGVFTDQVQPLFSEG